jgi:hypothetical protein
VVVVVLVLVREARTRWYLRHLARHWWARTLQWAPPVRPIRCRCSPVQCCTRKLHVDRERLVVAQAPMAEAVRCVAPSIFFDVKPGSRGFNRRGLARRMTRQMVVVLRRTVEGRRIRSVWRRCLSLPAAPHSPLSQARGKVPLLLLAYTTS